MASLRTRLDLMVEEAEGEEGEEGEEESSSKHPLLQSTRFIHIPNNNHFSVLEP